MLSVVRMDGLICPIEIHIMFADCIAVLVKKTRSHWFLTDILRLKKEKHPQAKDWILTGSAVIYVGSERNDVTGQSPGPESLIPHAAVTRLVVRPARRVPYPLPRQQIGEGREDSTGRFYSPCF